MLRAEDEIQDPRFQALSPEAQKKVIDALLAEERAGAGGAALTSKAGVEEWGGSLNVPLTQQTAIELGKAAPLPIAGGIIGSFAGMPAAGAMAGEFLSQELGLAPKSLAQMLLAGLPESAISGVGTVRRGFKKISARIHPELSTALREEAAIKGRGILRAARPPGGTGR